MTTEEMNRDIDLYMGNAYENPLTCLYSHSWDMIMPVWAKLSNELHLHENKLTGVGSVFNIEMAICNVDITKAHQLIHAAIVWLKSK